MVIIVLIYTSGKNPVWLYAYLVIHLARLNDLKNVIGES